MTNYTAIKDFTINPYGIPVSAGDTVGRLDDTRGCIAGNTLIKEYTFYVWVGSPQSAEYLQAGGQTPDPIILPGEQGCGGKSEVPQNADYFTVSGVDFGCVPKSVLVTVAKPIAESANIFATVRKGSITRTGFTVDFSAPLPSGGYSLEWFVAG